MMTSEEIIRLIFSFLGGGLVSGLFNWIRTNRSEKKAKQISNLQATIHNLYGPLQFFTSQNESYFKLYRKFHKAYQIEYSRPNWSQDERTQKTLNQQADKTLDIANTYIHIVTQNNEKILKVLENNYSFIDPDDVETFGQLMVDHTRLKTEMDESRRLNTPLLIYKHIGDISFMRPEFINKVKEKFQSKKKELESLIS